MEAWEIETKIPLYSEELISSFRKQLSIMKHPDWAFASDEAVIAELDKLGFTKLLMEEFDKALCKALGPAQLNPELPDSCNYFRKDYPPIDWKTIGVRVGKSYLDSKRRSMSNDSTK
jgi:hypothetical protein